MLHCLVARRWFRPQSQWRLRCFVCLFGLMLYVHDKQLRSCRDDQLSYPHCYWESLPEAGYQYLVHIFRNKLTNALLESAEEEE